MDKLMARGTHNKEQDAQHQVCDMWSQMLWCQVCELLEIEWTLETELLMASEGQKPVPDSGPTIHRNGPWSLQSNIDATF